MNLVKMVASNLELRKNLPKISRTRRDGGVLKR
jgi:hypothetical protein